MTGTPQSSVPGGAAADGSTVPKAVPAAPLAGYTVLDLTSVIMGPFATHILGDLGADVIKIESPEGDSIRTYAPNRHAGMSGPFLNLNRNKRSVCLDLKAAAGRQALDRLLTLADVFLHNLRPGPIDRLGYTYERVRGLNPNIIYCSARGFGEQGPYADKPAYDDIIQAGSGISALFQAVDDRPAYAPTAMCDKLTGQAIAYSILAALLQRERGGGGQAIEVPMFETSIEFNLMEHMGGFAFEPPLGRAIFVRYLSAFRRPFRTGDGFICILPYSNKNWSDFYAFTDRREFMSDARFATLARRVENIEILYRMIEQEAVKRTTEEWLTFCSEVGIPSMPVRSFEELAQDPHIQAVGLFEIGEHPTEGRYRVVRQPVRFSNAPFTIQRHAPNLGEHTSEVLRAAGLPSSLVAEVMRETALAQSARSGQTEQ